MNLFDTLTKEYKEFKPLSKEIKIYHCGPTVYSRQHIGNMRSVVIGDIIHRTMRLWTEFENKKLPEDAEKYTVSYVRNYTDVGHLTGDNIGDADTGIDRIEKATATEHLSPDEIADKYIKQYNDDIQLLGTLPPTHTPRATDYIPEMTDMVSMLIDNGIAYRTPLAIYFDISKKPDYTKLSRQNLNELLSGLGHGEVIDSDKKNPGDFAIWFFKKGSHANALQTWEYLGEPGFPGWHIECSAMIKKLLGDTIDIHIGGIEHIPIHHTNEIAQSECANHAPLAAYWLHNEHLLVDGKKMSKSEGTSFTLSNIIERGYKPEHLRFFFLQAHYRSKQNFTWEALEAAREGFNNLIKKIARFEKTMRGSSNLPGRSFDPNLTTNDNDTVDFEKLYNIVIANLFNDFNISQLIGNINSDINILIEQKKEFYTTLLIVHKIDDEVLGLNIKTAVNALINENINQKIPDNVFCLAEERKKYKKSKVNFEEADRLRKEIQNLGFDIKDKLNDEYEISYKI